MWRENKPAAALLKEGAVDERASRGTPRENMYGESRAKAALSDETPCIVRRNMPCRAAPRIAGRKLAHRAGRREKAKEGIISRNESLSLEIKAAPVAGA